MLTWQTILSESVLTKIQCQHLCYCTLVCWSHLLQGLKQVFLLELIHLEKPLFRLEIVISAFESNLSKSAPKNYKLTRLQENSPICKIFISQNDAGIYWYKCLHKIVLILVYTILEHCPMLYFISYRSFWWISVLKTWCDPQSTWKFITGSLGNLWHYEYKVVLLAFVFCGPLFT